MTALEVVNNHPFLALLAVIFVTEGIYMSIAYVTRAVVAARK